MLFVLFWLVLHQLSKFMTIFTKLKKNKDIFDFLDPNSPSISLLRPTLL